MANDAVPDVNLSAARTDGDAVRAKRARRLGQVVLTLVLATIAHHAVAIAQARSGRLTVSNVAPMIGLNVVMLGTLGWLGREAMRGRRVLAAATATILFSTLMMVAFVAVHFGYGFTGTPLLLFVQMALSSVALLSVALALWTLAA